MAAAALTILGLCLPFPHTGFIRNALLAAALALLGLAWWRSRRPLTFGPLAIGWLPYLGVWLLAALLARTPGYSLREYVGEFVLPFLVYLAAVNCFTARSATRFVSLFIGLGVGLALAGMAGSWLRFGWIDFQYYHLFFLMDYKSFGTLFVFLIPFAGQRLLRRWWYAFPLGLFLFNLVIIYCRSAWVGVAAGVVAALGWFTWSERGRLARHRRSLLVGGGAVLAIVAAIAAALLLFSDLGRPVRQLLRAREGWENPLRFDRFRQDGNIAARLRLWLNAAPMVVADPLLGYGPGIDTFRERYAAYKRPQDELIWHPHNEFYRALLEGGVLGLLALLALLALLGHYLAVQFRARPEHAAWTVPLLMVVVGFWVRNQFDCHFLDDKQWLFWLLVGMTMAATGSGARGRVVLLSREYPPAPGGIGRVADQLQRHLAVLGVPTAVIAAGPAASGEPVAVVRVAAAIGGRRAVLNYQLGALLRFGADPPAGVIALQWHPEGTTARLARRLYGIPFLLYAHGKEIMTTAPAAARRFERVAAAARGVVAVSRATAARLAGVGIDPARVRVIPNGVTVFPETAGAPVGKKERLILGVGRLVPRKRFDLLVAAAPAARRAGWSVELVGDGPERARLERQSRELDAGVGFHGTVSDAVLADAYRRAAIVVLPAADDGSGFEGLGIALLEGMAAGAVPVGSDSGGIPELISDGENGLLFPAGDGAALARGLERLLTDGGRRDRLAAAARATAAHYSWPANARALRDWLLAGDAAR